MLKPTTTSSTGAIQRQESSRELMGTKYIPLSTLSLAFSPLHRTIHRRRRLRLRLRRRCHCCRCRCCGRWRPRPAFPIPSPKTTALPIRVPPPPYSYPPFILRSTPTSSLLPRALSSPYVALSSSSSSLVIAPPRAVSCLRFRPSALLPSSRLAPAVPLSISLRCTTYY